MKISMKRLGALIMALVMVFGLLPVINNTVNAVDVTGLTDGTIGVSYVLGNNPGTGAGVTAPNGNSLTAVISGKLVGSSYIQTTNTVTITNNKTDKATLSFDFTLSGTFGTVAIDGTSYTSATSGSFSKDLDKGASVTIKLTSKRTAKSSGGNALTLAITNLSLTLAGVGPVTTTFEAPAFGSYTVAYGSTTLTVAAGTASQEVTNEASVSYTLTAAPGEGYKLAGWYDSVADRYISDALSFVTQFEKAATVRPIIVPENTAVFMVGDVKEGDTYYFDDLTAAVEYAQRNDYDVVTLVQSGTLPAQDEAYVIPAGITLLIPRDTDYTPTGFDEFGPAPEYGIEVETPYAYLTLTMEEGAVLEVSGTLDIESKYTTAQGGNAARPYGGRPCGPYGAIYMSPNSNICVEDGGNLYVWGYIYGQGVVDAYAGAKVYELMQVLDFPGGGNMSAFVDSNLSVDTDLPSWPADTNPTNDYIKTFPFSQYYIQNIEVELNLYAGAEEYVNLAMTASSVSMGMPVKFIGDGGMFYSENGVITKKYDPSTDRLEVIVDGDASMSGITLDLTGTEYEAAMLQFLKVSKVDAATFILTLNSNISISIISGTTTIEQDLALLPGVEVYVAEGATMVVAQREFAEDEWDNLTLYGTGGYNIYLWDLENWGKYAFGSKYLIPASYSPTTGRYTRTYADLKDVQLCIDGTVLVEGFIYSTVTFDESEEAWGPISGGASVISNGTGKLIMASGCGIEDYAYCLDGTSSCDHFMYIDSVWLKNGDGSFLLTQCDFCLGVADETVEECQHYGMEYYYCDVHECWYTEGHGNCIAAVDITWIINGQDQTMEVPFGEIPVYPIVPSKPANGCTVYTFAGWATSANGEVLTELPAATFEATYFAIFTASENHVDNDKNHLCDGCNAVELSSHEDTDFDHQCDYAGCNASTSVCEDADLDHYCDYAGCQQTMSDHKDDNQDHYCDYTGCNGWISNHVDANFDHKCDYTGCNAVTSSCEDVNFDHYCDYAGCEKYMSDHVDADKDHYCDYNNCNYQVSVHQDNNQDHYCDYSGCHKAMSNHEDADQDHICDYSGCGETLSGCVDADCDHYCDYSGCERVMSDHEDADQNHICDYAGCAATLSQCADENMDHRCDYTGCQKLVSECEDTDLNHKCDYTGCQMVLSFCDDVNDDHKCDYTGCRATISNCLDNNQNHICDYRGCSAVLSVCVDANYNHKCDFAGCEKVMSNHEDADQNHYCDYAGCGEWMTDCQDNDQNHYCDYAGCGEWMSDCEDNDQNHFCDYTGCGQRTSYCYDGNRDHYCDYSGCGVKNSNCQDRDFNHYCDYTGCGVKTSDCKDDDRNHKCDYSGCKKSLSVCQDMNEDHHCDYSGCNSTLSNCVDTDADHFCDYVGCQAELTVCDDLDQNHYCDYAGCSEILSTCEDNDENHVCDYAGCSEIVSTCVDNNENHICDYAGCSEIMSTCVDNDKNHICDYTGCSEIMSDCEDTDADHFCDYVGCQAELTVCTDNDQNHKCDYAGCSKILSTCVDNNESHICDYTGCSKIMSTCVDNDENHICDYAGCNEKLSDCVDTDDHYCDYAGCDEKLSNCTAGETVEYILTEAGCQAGEKQVIIICYLCSAELENYTEEIPALGHAHANGWDYIQINNDVHQVWCADCWEYTYEAGHSFVNHVCSNCDWTEEMTVQFYNGDVLWTETTTPYGCTLGIAGMPVPAAPTGYQFAGWYTEGGVKVVHGMTVTENIVAYATWAKLTYTVTWNVGGVTTTEPYEYGDIPSFKGNTDKAADGCTVYTFAGWDKTLATVTGNMTYTAQYTEGISHIGDNNNDHFCDGNCNTKLSECGDTNEDHYCDYSGCNSKLSDCIDSDENHYCDYAGCDEKLSDCVDADDHICDYAGCNEKLSECVDDDENHICDYAGCAACTSDCKDDAEDGDHECDYAGCSEIVSVCAGGQADCRNGKFCSDCGTEYTAALGHGHTEGWEYVDCIEKHEVICKDCYNYSYMEDHTYVNHDCVCSAREYYSVTFMDGNDVFRTAIYPYGNPANFYGMPIPQAPTGYEWDGWYTADGVKILPGMILDSDVVCYATWKVRSFTLIVYGMDGSALLYTQVPYGTNVYNYVKDLDGGSVPVNVEDQIGELIFTGWADVNMNPIVDGYTMPAEDLQVINFFAFTGWIKYGYMDGWVYESLDQIQKTGWTEIDGSWYYLDTETGIRAEGLNRVSYPSVSINGITYAPNAEDVAYEGNSFIDKDNGLFLFDENGKFLSGYTGLLGDSYIVNGYMPWHYGLVEINGEYYYFIGDAANGGNVMVKGRDYYVGRNTATNRSFVIGGLYTFGADGAMCMFEGITEVNGTLRYYEDAQLMLGKGLTQVGENYIYVSSYGTLVVDAEYYVSSNEYGVKNGIYYFDENGFLVLPEAKEGLFFEDGKWYYYVDGAKAYCAGLIEIGGNLVYVKSDGSLATGLYYVTNTNGNNDIPAGTKCLFDENGVMQDTLNGVVDGVYYKNNAIAYAAGLIETENGYIYVRSSGQIVTNAQYWITNVNDTGVEPGYYYFDENGIMAPAFTGVKDGSYYVDGSIAYAAGLVETENGYVYVRSNGQLATGKYWVTNVNDTGVEAGYYNFDEDGYMIVE